MYLAKPTSDGSNSSRQDHVILIASLGTITICAGLICLNFRARLLNRTTWKDKQHRSSSQAVSTRGQHIYTTKANSDCDSISNGCLTVNPIENNETVQAIARPHCLCLPNTNGSQNLELAAVPKHSDVLHDNRCVADSSVRKNLDSNHDFTRERHPSQSKSTSNHRNLQIPSWALRVIQYLAELRSSAKPSIIPPKFHPHTDAATTVTDLTTGIANSCSESTHPPPLVPSSVPKLSWTNRYSRRTGVSPVRPAAWPFGRPEPHAVHHEQTTAVHGLATSHDGATETTNRCAVPDDIHKSSDCQKTFAGFQSADADSLLSNSDVIDPVYSKIYGSNFRHPGPDDNDSMLGSCDWSPPLNGHRDSFISYCSEESDHASAHIYHQLTKTPIPSQNICSVHTAHQTGFTALFKAQQQAPFQPLSNTSSAWSIRLMRPSPLRKVIDCMTAPRSAETVIRLGQNTPPQLPDRTYGQSTVNLVQRLRSLLRYKEHHLQQQQQQQRGQSNTCRGPVLKAATLTSIPAGSVNDPPCSQATKSCIEVNEARLVSGLSRRSDRQLPENQWVGSALVQSRFTDVSQTGTASHEAFPTSNPLTKNGHISSNSLASMKFQSVEIGQTRSHCAGFEYLSSSEQSFKGSLHEFENRLWLVPIAGSYGNIRHIDSEVDLMNEKSNPTSGVISQLCRLGAVTPTPLRHIYLPVNSVHTDSITCGLNITASDPQERPPSHPMTVLSSPTKSFITSQPRMLMSPLMERSMEDDEMRHAISYSPVVPTLS